MSDIWSVGDSEGGSVGVADGSEDWGCSSGSEAEEQPPRKRAKRGNASKQQHKVCLSDAFCTTRQSLQQSWMHVFGVMAPAPILSRQSWD